jgi:hypothetical protein
MQAMKDYHLAVHLSIEAARWQFNLDEVWQIALRRQRPLRAKVCFLIAYTASGHRPDSDFSVCCRHVTRSFVRYRRQSGYRTTIANRSLMTKTDRQTSTTI